MGFHFFVVILMDRHDPEELEIDAVFDSEKEAESGIYFSKRRMLSNYGQDTPNVEWAWENSNFPERYVFLIREISS